LGDCTAHKCQGAQKSILCEGISFLNQTVHSSHSLVSAREVFVGVKVVEA
jgi:hypothetical protein